VGSQQEETISEVRGTAGARGDTIPLRNPPARAQVPEDLLECSATVNAENARDVFGKEPARADFLRDAPDFRPEPALVFDAFAFSGDAGALAGKTGNDEIHASAIRLASEGFQIVEDRTWIHGTFGHSTSEDRSRVGLPLDNTHSANSGHSTPDGALEPAVSRAERKYSSGTNNHIVSYLRRYPVPFDHVVRAARQGIVPASGTAQIACFADAHQALIARARREVDHENIRPSNDRCAVRAFASSS
jgi:hypothetical protein